MQDMVDRALAAEREVLVIEIGTWFCEQSDENLLSIRQ